MEKKNFWVSVRYLRSNKKDELLYEAYNYAGALEHAKREVDPKAVEILGVREEE